MDTTGERRTQGAGAPAGIINRAVGYGTNLLANRIDHYVTVARDVSEVLRERDEPQAAGMVETVATRGLELTAQLRAIDARSLWQSAQSMVRERPWLMAGIGVASGLGLARAIRSAGSASPDSYWVQEEFVESYVTVEED
jgi:ElaB/YqjD/DUF883 family membrane-anchored ribosome-binding protein